MIDANEQVILVNAHDEALGLMDKLEAHRSAHLHRAFSLLICNDKQQMLLQQRANCKYHSPLLWTNACCSHPREGETVTQAAIRRTHEELNIEVKLPQTLFSFIYKAELDHGMSEHEYDHVLLASYNDALPAPNPEEVANLRWISLPELDTEMKQSPEQFTAWFTILMTEHRDRIHQSIQKL